MRLMLLVNVELTNLMFLNLRTYTVLSMQKGRMDLMNNMEHGPLRNQSQINLMAIIHESQKVDSIPDYNVHIYSPYRSIEGSAAGHNHKFL